MKHYYHATAPENLFSILTEGIHKGTDGFVYLADSYENAAKFVAVRGCNTHILSIEVLLDEKLVEESFDHSFMFFKCRAYTYSDDIAIEHLTGNIMEYKN